MTAECDSHVSSVCMVGAGRGDNDLPWESVWERKRGSERKRQGKGGQDTDEFVDWIVYDG